MNDCNPRLRTLYEKHIDSLRAILVGTNGASGPLLLSVPDEYMSAPCRLLVVGQQTKGWCSPTDSLDEMLLCYADFALGKSYTRSPFWFASHELYSRLNPGTVERGFIWSNLVRADVGGERPPSTMESMLTSIGLLPAEIAVTEPGVVAFLTGPRYDECLGLTFPGLQSVAISRWTTRLVHPLLPRRSYRTYHPKWLRLKGHWGELARIVAMASAA